MKKIFFSVITLSFMLAGCSGESANSNEKPAAVQPLQYAVGSEDWSSIKQLGAKDNVVEAYQFAVDHPEVLNYMPCYCGCNEEEGHVSNTDCFVDKVEDNVAILDNMGLG